MYSIFVLTVSSKNSWNIFNFSANAAYLTALKNMHLTSRMCYRHYVGTSKQLDAKAGMHQFDMEKFENSQ